MLGYEVGFYKYEYNWIENGFRQILQKENIGIVGGYRDVFLDNRQSEFS